MNDEKNYNDNIKFPIDIELSCGHGIVTILYPSCIVKCGKCGKMTKIKA
jgi:hypothetical protein